MRTWLILACILGVGSVALTGSPASAKSNPRCLATKTPSGKPADAAQAIARLKPLLTPEQRAAFERPFDLDAAIQWSNLPVGIVPRSTLRLGDLDDQQFTALRGIFDAALSACGWQMLEQVRAADDVLTPLDTRPIGWSAANYYIAVLGDPNAAGPWMLQFGGHHLAYNFTFNGRLPGATPMFLGAEPISFEVRGKKVAPLDAQSHAMSRLATAVATHPQAKLSGTFTDVVKGVVITVRPGQPPAGGVDSGFPHSYPQGEQDRGVKVGTLSGAERALVDTAIQTFVQLPDPAVSAMLHTAYLQPEALAETFVGYSGSPDFSTRSSYVRIDGPRVWIEFVVQPAVALPTELHYHALWRDKQADYGGELRP